MTANVINKSVNNKWNKILCISILPFRLADVFVFDRRTKKNVEPLASFHVQIGRGEKRSVIEPSNYGQKDTSSLVPDGRVVGPRPRSRR